MVVVNEQYLRFGVIILGRGPDAGWRLHDCKDTQRAKTLSVPVDSLAPEHGVAMSAGSSSSFFGKHPEAMCDRSPSRNEAWRAMF